MNIFPPFRLHPHILDKFNNFEDALEDFITHAFNTNKIFFRSWLMEHLNTIHTGPYRMFSLFFPVHYQNEQFLSDDNKIKLKEYKKQYVRTHIEFLQKYEVLLENNAEEEKIIDLLIEYEVAGFHGMRKLKEEEIWLKKELKTIKEE